MFSLPCRHVVNGEILGVSLLLEDVLQRGLPDNFFAMQSDDSTSVTSVTSRTRPGTSTSRKTVSKHSSHGSLEDGEAFDMNNRYQNNTLLSPRPNWLHTK